MPCVLPTALSARRRLDSKPLGLPALRRLTPPPRALRAHFALPRITTKRLRLFVITWLACCWRLSALMPRGHDIPPPRAASPPLTSWAWGHTSLTPALSRHASPCLSLSVASVACSLARPHARACGWPSNITRLGSLPALSSMLCCVRVCVHFWALMPSFPLCLASICTVLVGACSLPWHSVLLLVCAPSPGLSAVSHDLRCNQPCSIAVRQCLTFPLRAC